MSENGPLVVRRDFGCKTGALQFRSKKCNLAESAMHLVERQLRSAISVNSNRTPTNSCGQNSYRLIRLIPRDTATATGTSCNYGLNYHR